VPSSRCYALRPSPKRQICLEWQTPFRPCAGPPIFTLAIFEEATARPEQATKYTESAGFMAFHPLALVHRSEAYLRSGDQEKAAKMAGRAAQLALDHRQDACHARALWMLGEVSANLQNLHFEAAEGHYRESMHAAADLGMQPLVAHRHSASASSTTARPSASRPGSISPPRRRCTARWDDVLAGEGEGRSTNVGSLPASPAVIDPSPPPRYRRQT